VVTQAMTSLTGSAGEDFASILRALGYRMERRPAPPKPAVVEAEAVPEMAPEATAETSSEAVTEGAPVVAEKTLPAETPPPEPAAESGDVADTASDVPPTSEEVVSMPSAASLPDIAFSPATGTDEPASVEVESTDVPSDQAASSEAHAGEATQEQAAGETAVETTATDAVVAAETDTTAAATPDAVAAPEMVDVWRPGGRPDDRRPRHERHRHRHQDRPPAHPQEGAPPSAVANNSADGARRERHGRGRRDRHNDFRKPSTDAPVETVAAADAAPVREPREDKGRPPRERFQGKDRHQDRDKGKFGGGRDKGGREKGGRGDKRSEGGPSHRQFATSAPPRERDRPIDPNSPFAKLAVLKEQLTARKDQR
jgi:ATP-dependent RNA helicase SUPV3L1/SUV3